MDASSALVTFTFSPQRLHVPVFPGIATIFPLHFFFGQGMTLEPFGRAILGLSFLYRVYGV